MAKVGLITRRDALIAAVSGSVPPHLLGLGFAVPLPFVLPPLGSGLRWATLAANNMILFPEAECAAALHAHAREA